MAHGKKTGQSRGRWLRRVSGALLLLFVLPVACNVMGRGQVSPRWQDASHDPTGQAPDPSVTPEAVLQVYAARAFGWRGTFGVHSWFALKPAGGDAYTRIEVIGWRVRGGSPAIRYREGGPDNEWFGNRPDLLLDRRGADAETLITKVLAAAKSYPFADSYRLWPGPNSNTFTAYIARRVPELGLEMPGKAIGKDYLVDDYILGPAPSGTGYQLSLFGLAGVLVAREEGLEINLLGLTFGIDFKDLAIKLPGVGQVGI
jgi:hypothetical protein